MCYLVLATSPYRPQQPPNHRRHFHHFYLVRFLPLGAVAIRSWSECSVNTRTRYFRTKHANMEGRGHEAEQIYQDKKSQQESLTKQAA